MMKMFEMREATHRSSLLRALRHLRAVRVRAALGSQHSAAQVSAADRPAAHCLLAATSVCWRCACPSFSPPCYVCARDWLAWLDRNVASVLNMSRRKRIYEMTPAEREAHIREVAAKYAAMQALPGPTDEQCE